MSNEHSDNPFVHPAFRCPRLALQLLGAAIVLGLVTAYPALALGAFIAAGVALVGACAACWYFVYKMGLQHAGKSYAIGHVVLAILLTPVFFLGIVFIPLLIQRDIERAAVE